MTTRSIITVMVMSGLCLLAACNKPPKLPATGGPKIVLLGELVAEDSVYFRAAQSIPVVEGGSARRILIEGLEVSVQTPEGSLWSLNSMEDDLTQQELTLPYFSGNKTAASKTYNITALHPSFGTATVSVPIPAPFTAEVVDTASVVHGGEDCYAVNLRWTDPPVTGQGYDIEVVQQPYTLEPAFLFNGQWLKMSEYSHIYDSLINEGITPEEGVDSFYQRNFARIIFYCDDPASEHVRSGTTGEKINRVLFSDERGNGTTMQTRIYIPKMSLMAGVPGLYGYKTWLQVKSVSSDYYRYLKAYSLSGGDSGFDFFNGMVVIKGNVQNGLGVVGGVYRRQFGFDW